MKQGMPGLGKEAPPCTRDHHCPNTASIQEPARTFFEILFATTRWEAFLYEFIYLYLSY